MCVHIGQVLLHAPSPEGRLPEPTRGRDCVEKATYQHLEPSAEGPHGEEDEKLNTPPFAHLRCSLWDAPAQKRGLGRH